MIVARYDIKDYPQGIRVLPITDRHNRDKDFDTVGGFVKVQGLIGNDIINFFKNDTYKDIAVHMGDVFDQGYRSAVATYVDSARERRLRDVVDNDNFLVVGNHLYIQRDSNPEFLMLQPDSRFVTKKKLDLVEEDKVFHVIDAIIIGDVQISLVHYQEGNKNYKRVREPGIKTHIALFHDDNVIPSSIKQGRGMRTTISSEYLSDVLEDIDMAIVAHWHEAIGKIDIHVNGKLVPMWIPGGLTHTSTSLSERHKAVSLPSFVFTEEGMRVELVTFKTYLNELKFYTSNDSDFKKKQKEQMRKEGRMIRAKEMVEAQGTSFDVLDYIRNGSLGPTGVKLFQIASRGELTLYKALDITKEVLSNGE